MIGATPQRPVPGATEPSGSVPPSRRIESRALLAGQRELIIEHGTDNYRLRLTSKGKLILTK
jgi:hemin uptake protein HemP